MLLQSPGLLLCLMMELSPQQIQEDIKQSKIKEGMMWKKSRYLKEWRERWIVLTKDHLYSFEHKQVYTKPTEILQISEIETLKSYFKHQQEREFSFRAESKNINFYLAGKTNQEKWAWQSAIERAVDRNHNGEVVGKSESIQEYRNTFVNKEQVKAIYARASFLPAPVTQSPQKELTTVSLQKIKIEPFSPNKPSQEPINLNIRSSSINEEKETVSAPLVRHRIKQFEQPKPDTQEKEQQHTVERVVQRIVDRVVEVRVPEIVEKIVYVEREMKQLNQAVALTKEGALETLFNDIFDGEVEVIFFVRFVVSLALIDRLAYAESVVKVCLFHPQARHFSQTLILHYNNETQEDSLNQLLKFIILLYEQTEEYFYITDFKVLVDILCRQLELYRSELNHYLMLSLIRSLVLKDTWPKTGGYRVEDLKGLVEQIQNVSPSTDTKILTKELMLYL